MFGMSLFDAYDAISATVFFVGTSLMCALFVGWVLGEEARSEIERGSEGNRVCVSLWFLYVKYVVPFVILAVFVNSFVHTFLT